MLKKQASSHGHKQMSEIYDFVTVAYTEGARGFSPTTNRKVCYNKQLKFTTQ